MRKENIGKFMSVKDLTTYEVLKDEDLKGIKAKGKLLKHKKSGARVLLVENDDNVQHCISDTAVRQYRSSAYYGAFRTLRVKEFPGKGSICRAGEGIFEYIFKCNDVSG